MSAVLLVCAFLKLPTLNYAHDETDELIYWQLASNLVTNGNYSLHGSPLLSVLSPDVYDHPLFHHPPLFAASLVPFVSFGARNAAVIVSWIGHMLAVIAVGMVGWHTVRRRAGVRLATSPSFWLPVLGVATDPLLQFVSRKIWIDSLLAGLIALSIALLIVADGASGRKRRALFIGSGLLLGLACLAKQSAALVLPVHVMAAWRYGADARQRVSAFLLMLAPVVALVVPWCVYFDLKCGVFVPPWVKPDDWLVQHYAFLRAAVERPWYYYLAKLPLLVPLVFVCGWQLVRERKALADSGVMLGTVWFLVVLATLTATSANGYGFQMRHVAAAAPAAYVVALLLLLQRERPVMLLTSGLSIFVATVTGALYLLASNISEIASLPEIAHLVRLG